VVSRKGIWRSASSTRIEDPVGPPRSPRQELCNAASVGRVAILRESVTASGLVPERSGRRFERLRGHGVLDDPQSLRRSPDPLDRYAHNLRMRPASCDASLATGGSGRPASARAFLAFSGPRATNGSCLARLSVDT
jgi:hypothetical protein